MKVEKLTLKNFRNIKELTFLPDQKMNVICGPNAQGKTNLLEALWLFTGAKSFRGGKDSEFKTFGQDAAKITLDFVSLSVKNDAEIEIRERKKATLNGNTLQSPGKLAGNFCAIIFSPQDIELVKEGPSVRRKFLDAAIFQIYPKYAEICKNYVRAVAQRNAALKDLYYHSELSSLIDVFDGEIVANGKKIIEYRKKYITFLKETVPSIYSGISQNTENLSISYLCNCSSEFLEERLKNSRREDRRTGVTSVGPHRDDINVEIGGIDAKAYASQGQTRTAALSVKLAEVEIFKDLSGEYPVLILDDVMSELDLPRRKKLVKRIEGLQTLLTCTHAERALYGKESKKIRIENGNIKE